MFSSVLPGIRELRNPLASGALWLLALWVLFRDLIPTPDEAEGLLHDVYDLMGTLGAAVVLGAVAFAAYVLGVILSFITTVYVRAAEGLYVSRSSRRREVVQMLRAAQTRAERRGVSMEQVETLFSEKEVRDGLMENRRVAGTRLHAANAGVFDDYDRARAEGEFRIAIAWPLLFLGSATFVTQLGSPAGGVVLGISASVLILLLVFGAIRLRESDEVLYEAIVTGVIISPTIQALDALEPDSRPTRVTKAKISR